MKRSIVPIVLSYAAGILSEEFMHVPGSLVYVLLGVGAICHYVYRRSPYAMISASFVFLALGAIAIEPLISRDSSDDICAPPPKIVEGMISEAPERVAGGYRLILRGSGPAVSLSVPLRHPGPASSGGPVFSSPIRYGDVIRASMRLRRPKNNGNPGEFDYVRFLRFRGIHVLATITSFDDIAVIGKGGNPLWSWIEHLRERVGQGIDKAFAGDNEGNINEGGAVMRALILGEQGWLPKERRSQFTRTGTVHILVVSGLHLTLIAWCSYQFFIFVMKRSEVLLLRGLVQKSAACASVVPVSLYTALAGANIPLVRAYFMVLVFVLSFLTGRSRDIYCTLAVAALGILVLEPQALFSISFQLSFASVLSIVYLSPRMAVHFRRSFTNSFPEKDGLHVKFLRTLGVMGLTSVSASVGLSPILALYYNQVPIWGIMANIVVIPTLGFLCVGLGLLAGLVGFLSPMISSWLYSASKPFLWIGLHTVEVISSFPLASIRVSTPTIVELCLIYALIVVFANMREVRRSWMYLLILTALLMVDWGYWRYRVYHNANLQITYLSVGHGDSALVEFPGGKKLIVDGGPKISEDFDAGERIVAPYLWWRKISRVDYIAWSHCHADHIGGLPYIIDNFAPTESWGPSENCESDAIERLKNSLRTGLVQKITHGDGVSPLEIGGVSVDFLRSSVKDDPDEASLEIRLTYGDFSFLFTGDVKGRGEKTLLESGRSISATVLKVPHHGGEGTISEEFLDTVRPKVAIISLGRRHGFPSHNVIDKLKKRNIRILRTDSDGAVTIKTDGHRLETILYSGSRPTVVHFL